MKKLTLTLLIVFISLIFVNCSYFTKTETKSQVAEIDIYHRNDSLEFNIRIYSDPMVGLESLKINDKKIDPNNEFVYGSSLNNFTLPVSEINNSIDQINIDLETDIGKLTGSIIKPDSIIIESIPDSINLGEDITITWDGKADYYNITYMYHYQKVNDYIYSNWEYLDYITGNSIKITNDDFAYNGEITQLIITLQNGIINDDGTEGNLSGDGGGFIHYYEKQYELKNKIIIGEGLKSNIQGKQFNSHEIKQILMNAGK